MKVNCDLIEYLHALETADSRGTKEERAILREATKGLFRHVSDGRQIAICTWLMVLRADMRKHLALSGLLPKQETERVEVLGQTRHRRTARTQEQIDLALAKQRVLITTLKEKCPVFFEGMIEEAEPQRMSAISISSGGEVTDG